MICSEEFLKIIEAIDLQKEEIGDVYQELKKCFAPIAKQLHLARSMVTINVAPNVFAPTGEVRSFALVYDENTTRHAANTFLSELEEHCEEITPEEVRSWSFFRKIRNWIVRLLSGYLT